MKAQNHDSKLTIRKSTLKNLTVRSSLKAGEPHKPTQCPNLSAASTSCTVQWCC